MIIINVIVAVKKEETSIRFEQMSEVTSPKLTVSIGARRYVLIDGYRRSLASH